MMKMKYVNISYRKITILGYYANFDFKNINNEDETNKLRNKFREMMNANSSIQKDCDSSYLIRTNDTIKEVNEDILKKLKELMTIYDITHSCEIKLSLIKIRSKKDILCKDIDNWIKSHPIHFNEIKIY